MAGANQTNRFPDLCANYSIPSQALSQTRLIGTQAKQAIGQEAGRERSNDLRKGVMPVGAFLTRISVGLTLLLFLSVAQAAEKAPKRLLLDDFEGEVARRWQNLTASTNPVKAGKGAARWTGVDASNLKLPHDWSAYKTWNLSLWCHAEKATGARFLVMLASDSPKGDGPDFFYLPVTVDWKGWKEIRTPLAALKKWDHPVGLNRVDAVTFSTSLDWAGAKWVPGTVLHFDELALVE